MNNEMWTAMEAYQPHADAQSHGESWKQMTTERTPESLQAARDAAWARGAYNAAKAASCAARGGRFGNCGSAASQEAGAIECIKRAIKEAQS